MEEGRTPFFLIFLIKVVFIRLMNAIFLSFLAKVVFIRLMNAIFPIFLGKSGFHSSDERHFSYRSWQKWFSFIYYCIPHYPSRSKIAAFSTIKIKYSQKKDSQPAKTFCKLGTPQTILFTLHRE